MVRFSGASTDRAVVIVVPSKIQLISFKCPQCEKILSPGILDPLSFVRTVRSNPLQSSAPAVAAKPDPTIFNCAGVAHLLEKLKQLEVLVPTIEPNKVPAVFVAKLLGIVPVYDF